MATHTQHRSIAQHGLADHCVRCTDIAETPFESLDDDLLRDLVDRTVRWMDDDEHSLARSKNEQRAMLIVEKALTQRRILNRLDAEAV